MQHVSDPLALKASEVLREPANGFIRVLQALKVAGVRFTLPAGKERLQAAAQQALVHLVEQSEAVQGSPSGQRVLAVHAEAIAGWLECLTTDLVLVPTDQGVEDDYYLEVGHQRAGYLYRAGDGTWTVGVMTTLSTGDVGPFAQGLVSQSAAQDFALQHLPK